MSKEALLKSIEEWEGKLTKLEHKETPTLSPNSCPLCEQYWESLCIGCPVFTDTGYRGCSHTPYNALYRHLRTIQQDDE